MNVCIRCKCDLEKINDDLKKLNYAANEFEYCPECGLMLFQDCPECGETKLSFQTKLCPKCNHEIIFCAKCYKINSSSYFNCDECGKTIRVLENMFLSACAGYNRTNVYSAKKRGNVANESLTIPIGADFSKAVIRNGAIYFWKKQAEGKSKLVWFDISQTIDTGWRNEKSSSDICAIEVNDIENIEVFNQYILTGTKQKLLINSADNGKLIKSINLREDLTDDDDETEIKSYKASIINNILILSCVTSADKQKILSMKISSAEKSEQLFEAQIPTGYSIGVEAPPLMINGNCVYFAGYDGDIYKIFLNDKSDKLEYKKISVNYPNLSNGLLCISQIASLNEDLLYLTVYSQSNTYLFVSINGSEFSLLGDSSRFELDKISFYNNYFYVFNKDPQGKIHFSQPAKDNIKNPKSIFSDFNDMLNIYNYYIASIQNVPYLIYMQSTKSPRQIRIYCRSITGNMKESKMLTQLRVCEDSEFLILDNFIVICDHYSENNYIIVKRWN